MASGIKITRVDGNWQFGTIDGVEFQVKVYEEPSEEYGIDGGNISKLWIKDTLTYDRGWNERPRTKKAKELLKRILKHFEIQR